MDGPALYEAVAVVFIAQLNGVDLSFAEIVTVAVTTTLASLGTGPIPAGLLPILVVLPAIGLPVNNISFIVTVDWLLDRIRTALNVLCDGFAAAVIEKLTKTELQRVSTYNRELAEEIQEEIEQLNGPHPEHTNGHTTKPSDYN
uniref:Amino acid transporter n=1 Tax=Plectus sambesii TaxID=2011161 RepID=A0A914WM23_9BILA